MLVESLNEREKSYALALEKEQNKEKKRELIRQAIEVLNKGEKELLRKKIRKEERAPYLYQELASKLIKGKRDVYLFLEMGLGKTKVVAEVINENKGIKKGLIVGPGHILTDLKENLEKDLKRKDLKVKILRKMNTKKIKELIEKEGNVIHIINVETFRKIFLGKIKVNLDLLVLDEAHHFKNKRSLNYRAARRATRKAKLRMYLTGTPISRSIDDLINLMSISQEIPIYKYYSIEDVISQVKEHAVVISQEDVFELPPLEIKKIVIDGTKELEKYYLEAKKKKNEGERIRDILTLSSFFLYIDAESGSYKLISEKKLEELVRLIEKEFQKDEVVIIYYNFQAEKDMLLKYLKERIKGRKVIALEEDLEDLEIFKTNSIVLMQLDKFSEGLNLQKYTNKLIFFSLSYKYIKFKQALKRVHRIGQEKECKIYVFITLVNGKELGGVSKNLEWKDKLTKKLFEREKKKYEYLKVYKLLEKLEELKLEIENGEEEYKEAVIYKESEFIEKIERASTLSEIEKELEALKDYLSTKKIRYALRAIRGISCLDYKAYVIREKLDGSYEHTIRLLKCNLDLCNHCQFAKTKKIAKKLEKVFLLDEYKKNKAYVIKLKSTFKIKKSEKISKARLFYEKVNELANAIVSKEILSEQKKYERELLKEIEEREKELDFSLELEKLLKKYAHLIAFIRKLVKEKGLELDEGEKLKKLKELKELNEKAKMYYQKKKILNLFFEEEEEKEKVIKELKGGFRERKKLKEEKELESVIISILKEMSKEAKGKVKKAVLESLKELVKGKSYQEVKKRLIKKKEGVLKLKEAIKGFIIPKVNIDGYGEVYILALNVKSVQTVLKIIKQNPYFNIESVKVISDEEGQKKVVSMLSKAYVNRDVYNKKDKMSIGEKFLYYYIHAHEKRLISLGEINKDIEEKEKEENVLREFVFIDKEKVKVSFSKEDLKSLFKGELKELEVKIIYQGDEKITQAVLNEERELVIREGEKRLEELVKGLELEEDELERKVRYIKGQGLLVVERGKRASPI